jgi:hypothetical protein
MKQIAFAMMLAIVALLAFAHRPANAEACGTPATLDDGWLTDTPGNVGVDGARLCGIPARMTATNANVHAVVVVRKSKLVYEHYSRGHGRFRSCAGLL